MSDSKYDIAKEFTAGLVSGLGPITARKLTESDHWIAGWMRVIL